MTKKGLGAWKPKWAGGQKDTEHSGEGAKGLNGVSRKGLNRRQRGDRATQSEVEVEVPVIETKSGAHSINDETVAKNADQMNGFMGRPEVDDTGDNYTENGLSGASPASMSTSSSAAAPTLARRPLINSTEVTSRSVSGEKEMKTDMINNSVSDVNDRMSVISAKMVLTGAKIDVREDIVIFGKFDGDLSCETLIIKDEAKVSGTIRAKRIDIYGELIGDVESREIFLMKKGLLGGNVKCDIFGMKPGASLKATVECDVDDQLADKIGDSERIFDAVESGAEGAVVPMQRQASGSRG